MACRSSRRPGCSPQGAAGQSTPSGEGQRYALLARGLSEESGADELFKEDAIDDDVLALMSTACHPVISKEARIALTLRVVAGSGSGEIAGAFLVPVPTIQARITRAKKTLAAARVPFAVPESDELAERLDSVLQATRLKPEPEVFGLLELLEFTAAGCPARIDDVGRPGLLEDQDRGLWDRSAIHRGRATRGHAVTSGRGLGAYGLQASISECHATATSVADTDWSRITVLYEALGRLTPSPVVELNPAVAVAWTKGRGPAWPWWRRWPAGESLPARICFR
jgi:predicted RNA polymerase sigma factor